MRTVHDERTGRVRCDDDALDALLRDPSTGPASVAMDERTSAALGAVAHALTEGRVLVSTSSSVRDHRFWIAPGAAAFFLALGDGLGDLVGVAPALVPERLAGLVGLGPRRVVGVRSPLPVAPDLLEDLLSASDLRRSSALAVLGARRAWRLDVEAPAHEQVPLRTMTVIDGSRGYWLVADADTDAQGDAGDGAVLLAPTTATVLWRRLATVLA